MINKNIKIILLSAILYGISIPFSKVITENAQAPAMIGAFMYLGSGIGLLIYNIFNKIAFNKTLENPLTKKELPYIIAMVILDISAIILLMNGILRTTSANASLLNNCEIVATSLIAFIFFKEKISQKLFIAIILITIAGIILTFEGEGSFKFSIGSILVIASCICWGAENNCTKMISSKNTHEITIIKGIFSGAGSLAAAMIAGEKFLSLNLILLIMLIGFFSYGLSVAIYIKSQSYLGAAKTAAYFSTAPFFGVIFSLLFLGEIPSVKFYISFFIMLYAVILAVNDYKK